MFLWLLLWLLLLLFNIRPPNQRLYHQDGFNLKSIIFPRKLVIKESIKPEWGRFKDKH